MEVGPGMATTDWPGAGDSPATEAQLPTVAVLIPTMGREKVLRAVDAVLAQSPTEVIVVINGAPVADVASALEQKSRRDPRLRTFVLETAGQFPALQFAAEQSTADVMLCLDDDVMAGPGLVAGHAGHHRGHEGLLVLGYMPVLLPSPRRRGQAPTFLYAKTYEGHCAGFERDPSKILGDLWAGNFSLRRADALAVGLANPVRFPYHGDQELGVRCRAAGIRAVFDRRLLAHHEHARSIEKFLSEAEDRAYAAYLLTQLHPDDFGPEFLEQYGKGLRAPARLVVSLGRWPLAYAVAMPAARAVMWASGVVRWWKLESLAADVALNLRELSAVTELQRGGAARTAPGDVPALERR
jgi:glycosyltransferase involved in cell wall biosynthesis